MEMEKINNKFSSLPVSLRKKIFSFIMRDKVSNLSCSCNASYYQDYRDSCPYFDYSDYSDSNPHYADSPYSDYSDYSDRC